MSSLGATNSSTSPEEMLPGRSTAETIEILIYAVCLCIGGPLNVYSFRKMLRRNFRQSRGLGTSKSLVSSGTRNGVQRLLKLNLNMADLLTMFIYTSSQIAWMLTYQWYAGDPLCRIVKFFHTFGFYLNSFVVACFAIDRAIGTRNLGTIKSSEIAIRRTKVMLVVAWAAALVLSLPQSVIFRVVEVTAMGIRDFKQCTPLWTIATYELDLKWSALRDAGKLDRRTRDTLLAELDAVVRWERIYNVAHLLFVFWIPTLLIIGSYTMVICNLNSFAMVHADAVRMALRRTIRRVSRSTSFQRHLNGPGTPTPCAPDEPASPTPLALPTADAEYTTIITSTSLPNNGHTMVESKLLAVTPAHQSKTGRGEGEDDNVQAGPIALQAIFAARQRATKQAALILAAYLTFWSPYNILAIINAFSPKEGSLKEIASVSLPFLNAMIVMNPIVNPIIYELLE